MMNPNIGNQIPSLSHLTAKGLPQSSPLKSKQTAQARMLTSPSRVHSAIEPGSSTNPVSHLSCCRLFLMVRSCLTVMMRIKICLLPRRPNKSIKPNRLSLARWILLHSMSSLSSSTRVREGMKDKQGDRHEEKPLL